MKYIYYPGCSLEGTAAEYNSATRWLMGALDIELLELEEWTCCGATAAPAVGHLLSMALPARNLALAEKTAAGSDILVPCSACYLNLKKVEQQIRTDAALFKKINQVLEAEALVLHGKQKVRHLLDVLVTDIAISDIVARCRRTFENLRIAPYYGCQCLRPYAVFDDPEEPRSMEPLLAAVGAAVHPWDMGGKCCGASLVNTKPQAGIALVAALLNAARGADAIVTVCPMCQMNLEAYQKQASRSMQQDLQISILYLPQLLGLALGASEQEVRLDLNLCVTNHFKQKLASSRARQGFDPGSLKEANNAAAAPPPR
jgi:heterodisulfide reductase subunit B2